MSPWRADLPGNIDPPENVCYAVEIPNDPDYIAAFWGAYEQLSHWWAWQRDPAKQGKDAARRWRLAVQETWKNFETIGDMCDLDINITCGAGPAACCDQQLTIILNNQIHLGSGVYDSIIALPDDGTDDGVNPPSSEWEFYDTYLQHKCNVASRIAIDLLGTLDNFGSAMAGLENLSLDSISALLGSTWVSALTGGLVGTALVVGTGIERIISTVFQVAEADRTYLSQFQQAVDQLTQSALTCASYDAGSPLAAQTATRALWDDALTAAGIGETGVFSLPRWEFERLFDSLTPHELFTYLFGGATIETGILNYDCSACTGVQSVDLANGLLHYWEFETDVDPQPDSHGTYDLPRYGCTIEPTGITANCIDIPAGTSHRLDIASTPDMTNTASWTYAVWINMDALPADSATIVSKGRHYPAETDAQFNVTVTPTGTVDVRIRGTYGRVDAETVGTVTLGQWHLVIVQWDQPNQVLSISLDNATPVETSVPDGYYTADGRTTWGGYLNTSTEWGWVQFDGRIDEQAWWNRLLNSDERTELWNLGFGLSYANIIA